jgi:hypothetical protein
LGLWIWWRSSGTAGVVAGDQMLCSVTTTDFRHSPLLVGQHFQVQVGIALQKSGGNAQLKPVFSLLPVDLYSLLLPHYCAFCRHTIKLWRWHYGVLKVSSILKARSSG